MSFVAIQNAFNTRLQSVPGLPALQLENTANIAKTGQAFSRSTLIPSRSTSLNVGTNGTIQMSGLAQIDLFYPLNTGVSAVNEMVDAVIAAFPNGVLDAGSGLTVHVQVSWREAGSRIEQFYSVPVVVQWTAFSPNQ